MLNYRNQLAGILLLPLILGAWFLGWHSLTQLNTHFFGNGTDDIYSFLWILHQLSENLIHHPTSLFDGRIFFPSTDNLLYSETIFASSLIYRFFYSLSHAQILSYNLLILFFLWADFLAMYLFCRNFVGRIPAIFAAALFSFSPMRLGRLKHLHILPQFFLPLTAYCLWRYETAVKKKWALLAGAGTGLQFYFSLTSGILLVFSLLPYAFLSLRWQYRISKQSFRKRLKDFSQAGLILTAIITPMFVLYQIVCWKHGFGGNDLAAGGSANPKSYLVVPRGHLYANFLVDFLLGGENGNREEKILFVGFATLALAWVGYQALKKKPQLHPLVIPTLVFTFWYVIWLSMGINGGLYQVICWLLPPFKALRAAGRFGLTYLFIMAALAAVGLQSIWYRLNSRFNRFSFALLVLLLFLADQWFPVSMSSPPTDLSPVSQYLAATADKGPVLFIPAELFGAPQQMYFVTQHQHPIGSGWARFVPAEYEHSVRLSNHFLENASEVSLAAIRQSGFRYLVIEPKAFARLLSQSPLPLQSWLTFKDKLAVVLDLGTSSK